jgi:hypothetical protein
MKGVSVWALQKRVQYGGRKGRSAARRLRRHEAALGRYLIQSLGFASALLEPVFRFAGLK